MAWDLKTKLCPQHLGRGVGGRGLMNAQAAVQHGVQARRQEVALA